MNDILKINFSDSINTATAKSFVCSLEKLCLQYPNSDTLAISISSPGGDVDVAIELFYFCVVWNVRFRLLILHTLILQQY